MLQDYTGSVFVPAFWSLGAEEKFYLLAPLLALALVRMSRPWLQGAALLMLWLVPVVSRPIAARDVVPPLAYQAYFPAFRTEVLRPWTREAVFWCVAAALLAALAPATLLGQIGWWTIVATPAAVGVGFGAMVLACVSGGGSYSRCLAWAGWRPLALGSFSLYLTHMMVIPVAVAGSRAMLGATTPSTTTQWLAFLPWYLALSSVSAWALYAAVERPERPAPDRPPPLLIGPSGRIIRDCEDAQRWST